MKKAVLSVVIALGALQNSLYAQDADPAEVPMEENAPPESFEEAMQVAHSQYIANLKVALELALAEGKLDESVHVQRMVEMEEFRAEITGTSWARIYRTPGRISFLPNRQLQVDEHEGVWDVIEERTVIGTIHGADAHSIFRFNEDLTRYTKKTYHAVERETYTNGRRINDD